MDKKNHPDIKILYTLADGIMGKVGYVYQAFNFFYGGFFWTDVYMTETGEKVHPRSMKKLLVENAEFSNKKKLFWATKDFLKYKKMKRIKGKMFCYALPLNKKYKKLFENNKWTKKYPKEKDLEWKEQGEKKYTKIEKPNFSFIEKKINTKNINQFKE